MAERRVGFSRVLAGLAERRVGFGHVAAGMAACVVAVGGAAALAATFGGAEAMPESFPDHAAAGIDFRLTTASIAPASFETAPAFGATGTITPEMLRGYIVGNAERLVTRGFTLADPAEALTTEVLHAYVDARYHGRATGGGGPSFGAAGALTPELLRSYVARNDTRLLSPALDAIDSLSGGSPAIPVPAYRPRDPLTEDLLGSYVEANFRPTEERIDHAGTERECLQQAIYHEARGEPELGQRAVAAVILNRVASPRYPDTVCGVVFQNAHLRHRCQFSFACDGRPDGFTGGNRMEREAWARAGRIAETLYNQFKVGQRSDAVPPSTMYFHTRNVRPQWSNTFQHVATIGAHLFYAASR